LRAAARLNFDMMRQGAALLACPIFVYAIADNAEDQ